MTNYRQFGTISHNLSHQHCEVLLASKSMPGTFPQTRYVVILANDSIIPDTFSFCVLSSDWAQLMFSPLVWQVSARKVQSVC